MQYGIVLSHHHTVGARSITRFAKKYVLLRQNILGHRHGRELWVFLFDRSLPGKSIEVKNLTNIQLFFVLVGLKRPQKMKVFFHKKFCNF